MTRPPNKSATHPVHVGVLGLLRTRPKNNTVVIISKGYDTEKATISQQAWLLTDRSKISQMKGR